MPPEPPNAHHAFRNAVYERFPDSKLIDSVALGDLESGGLPTVTVTFVLAKGLETDSQRKRIDFLHDEYRSR
jgi:hypothetical protein